MLFNRLVQCEKVEKTVKDQKAAKIAASSNVQFCEEAKALPLHIQLATDSGKLNAQISYFVCPDWAGLPPTGYHLYCAREGIPLPALDLSRFPYYLFGRSKVADYVLDHPSISGVHAALVYHPERECFILLDLKSSHGVRVNRSGEETSSFERIGVAIPIPLAIGAKIRFGYSSRVYELRRGKPPSSKRLREEQEAALRQKKADAADSPSASSLTEEMRNGTSSVEKGNALTGATASPLTVKEVGSKETVEGGVAVVEVEPTTGAPPSTEGPSSSHVCRYHLYQLVLKHKDVRNPVNRGVKGKGMRVTRSKEDAIEMAWWILQSHQRQKEPPRDVSSTQEQAIPLGTRAGEEEKHVPNGATPLCFSSPTAVEWTVEEFTEAVKEYSEINSKHHDGDLGLVEKGAYHQTFDEAAFQLQRHRVSAPVETPLGIHLIFRSD